MFISTLRLVGLDECRLYCLASGHRMFAPLGNVKDGTICGKTDRKMQCQDGRCVVKGKVIFLLHI